MKLRKHHLITGLYLLAATSFLGGVTAMVNFHILVGLLLMAIGAACLTIFAKLHKEDDDQTPLGI